MRRALMLLTGRVQTLDRSRSPALGRARITGPGLVVMLLVLLSSCGQARPTVAAITEHTAAAMAAASYRISGSARAGVTTTTFSAETLPNGNFSGRVVTTVPGSPSLSLQVVAVGPNVYVLSPLGLAQLGITSLPGNLNPATTWVLQSSVTASRYRQSLAPFTGPGIARTLREYLKSPVIVASASLHGVAAWLVEEGSSGSSLRLYIAKGSYHLLQLTVTGRDPISLNYDLFGQVAPVEPPPAADIYSPPASASGS